MGVTVFRVDLTNISQSGMFVRPALHSVSSSLVAAAVLKPGKALRLRLDVACNAEVHEARARVTRQSDLGIGVEFIEVTPAFTTLIGQVVTSDGDDEPLRTITSATLTLDE
jgi:hypothetical protein